MAPAYQDGVVTKYAGYPCTINDDYHYCIMYQLTSELILSQHGIRIKTIYKLVNNFFNSSIVFALTN